MKVMIVDDHADIRRVLKNVVSFLYPGDVEFIECERGEEAVGRYILHHPGLVLMDIQLQGIDGFETIQKIYTQDKEAKIIVVTSFDTTRFRKKAEAFNLAGFVSKERLSDMRKILENINQD